MAVTLDDILARGKGPVQQTWADDKTSVEAPATSPPAAAPGATSTPVATPTPSATEAAPMDQNTGVPRAATDIEHNTPVSEQQTASKGKKLTYTEMYQQMSPYKPPTPEEVEKERKRQKREAVFSAIGEGISALSNLFFTSQYAPDAYDPSQGMAATTKKRFDQLKKEREDNQRQYMEGFMRAMRWDAEDARDERNWNHTIERERVTDHYKEAADARAQAKADRDAAMAQLRMDLMQGKVNQQEAAAEAKRIEADYAEAYWQSRINKNNYRRTIGSRGGSGGKKGPKLQLEDDEPMYFDNEKDYERTVLRLASHYGVPTEKTEIRRRNLAGEPEITIVRKYTINEIASEIEEKAAEKRAAKKRDAEESQRKKTNVKEHPVAPKANIWVNASKIRY